MSRLLTKKTKKTYSQDLRLTQAFQRECRFHSHYHRTTVQFLPAFCWQFLQLQPYQKPKLQAEWLPSCPRQHALPIPQAAPIPMSSTTDCRKRRDRLPSKQRTFKYKLKNKLTKTGKKKIFTRACQAQECWKRVATCPEPFSPSPFPRPPSFF